MATSLYKAQEASKTCEKHEHMELTCFCKTCRKFICIFCTQTTCTPNGHEWDLIASVAKKRRKNIPKLCQEIREKHVLECRQKLQTMNDNLKESKREDMEKLEKKETAMIKLIKRIIKDERKKRDELARNEKLIESKCRDLEKKLDYVSDVTFKLVNSVESYSDYDLIEIQQDMLIALEEVESFDEKLANPTGKFVPGETNERTLEEMIGKMEESSILGEVKSIKMFNNPIDNISPISNAGAAVVEWLSSWLAEQEDRGWIPGLTT